MLNITIIAATFGIVFPSFAVIYAISLLLDHFLEIAIIANASGESAPP